MSDKGAAEMTKLMCGTEKSPQGWFCTRRPRFHDGPCAAVPVTEELLEEEADLIKREPSSTWAGRKDPRLPAPATAEQTDEQWVKEHEPGASVSKIVGGIWKNGHLIGNTWADARRRLTQPSEPEQTDEQKLRCHHCKRMFSLSDACECGTYDTACPDCCRRLTQPSEAVTERTQPDYAALAARLADTAEFRLKHPTYYPAEERLKEAIAAYREATRS